MHFKSTDPAIQYYSRVLHVLVDSEGSLILGWIIELLCYNFLFWSKQYFCQSHTNSTGSPTSRLQERPSETQEKQSPWQTRFTARAHTWKYWFSKRCYKILVDTGQTTNSSQKPSLYCPKHPGKHLWLTRASPTVRIPSCIGWTCSLHSFPPFKKPLQHVSPSSPRAVIAGLHTELLKDNTAFMTDCFHAKWNFKK